MKVVTWSEEYSVDIQEIDEQHKVLVGLINELYEALSHKDNHEQVNHVLDELMNYTKVHFAVEECLLRLFEYPSYDQHKAIHDGIIKKLDGLYAQFKSGDTKVGMELLLFLKDWLMDHISHEDKKYSPHLQKQGVKRHWIKKFW
jgi:hemerythrin